MKYVEQVKSFVLLFLVLLSVVLTLLIWNYKPDYAFLEEAPVEEIAIGEEKQLKDILKPYRLLFARDGALKGTVSSSAIDSLYQELTTWRAEEFNLINSNLSNDKLNEVLRVDNRMTLFFSEQIPLPLFAGMLEFQEDELPEVSFDRIILDWGSMGAANQLQLLFVNKKERSLYRAYVTLPKRSKFKETVLDSITYYDEYVEIERLGELSMYVAQEPMESIQYTYYIDDISPDLFKNILFTDPSIVQRNVESAQSERYTDGMSLMTVDTQNRILNYVYPAAESITPIPASKLIRDSVNFLNEHGGFTADYRFSAMNASRHAVEYQMYLQGYPVYSHMTTTRITTTWGDNRIFRYRRPYYSLDVDITSVKTVRELPSGEEVVAHIQDNPELDYDAVSELVVGYYLMQNQNLRFYTLEPSWFALINGSWTRIMLGGNEDGLE
ncbi:MAG: two-component system activity regulator YycH [Solibacillus sp.]